MRLEAFFYLKIKNFIINLTIKEEKLNIITIYGESGSGKTTFLKFISGLIKPKNGYLSINGIIFQDSKKKIFIETKKRKIGYITQNITLFNHLSVIENILIGFKKKDDKIKENIINIFKLNKILKRKINELSGGEKQRVLIAQVLLTQPDIIIMDEALSAQDSNMKDIIIKYIKNLNEKFNIPIIYVSHNITELKKLSKKIIFLNKGKIIYKKLKTAI